MDGFYFIVALLALGLVAISLVTAVVLVRLRTAGEQAQTLIGKQAELSGQLGQIASEAVVRQEQLRNTIDARLDQVTSQMGDNRGTVRANGQLAGSIIEQASSWCFWRNSA